MAAGHRLDPEQWRAHFGGLMGRIAGRFARVEPRRHDRDLVLGLMSELPGKNCWTIAEHAGHPTPGGLQHLLARAVRDAGAVRDDLRGYVTGHLGGAAAPWVAGDEVYGADPGLRRELEDRGTGDTAPARCPRGGRRCRTETGCSHAPWPRRSARRSSPPCTRNGSP